jgi:hypothetical protein
MTITARVERTAGLLDEFYPGWADKINLRTLDMHNGEKCVGGQLGHAFRSKSSPYGPMYLAFTRSFLRKIGAKNRREVLRPLGRYVSTFASSEALAFGVDGRNAWRREIRKRQTT